MISFSGLRRVDPVERVREGWKLRACHTIARLKRSAQAKSAPERRPEYFMTQKKGRRGLSR